MSAIDEFTKVFDIYKNNNNLMERNKILEIMKELEINLNKQDINTLNEHVTFDEWMSLIHNYINGNNTNDEIYEVLSSFNTFDANDNTINIGEFISKLKTYGEKFTDDEINEIIKELYPIENGLVQIQKIINMTIIH